MTSQGTQQKDWFIWAESFLADWKARDTEWAESFTAAAERVLAGATQAARSLNQDYVGAEHLLAGILRFSTGAVARTLEDTGLTLALLKKEIETAYGSSSRKKLEKGIPYTPRCRGIIERARTRARERGGRTDIKDLLIELLAEKEGLPASIIRTRAIDMDKIKRAMAADLLPR